MEQDDPAKKQVDEDQAMKSAMEKIAPSYDSYMRTMTLGRERALRELTVELAGVKPVELARCLIFSDTDRACAPGSTP